MIRSIVETGVKRPLIIIFIILCGACSDTLSKNDVAEILADFYWADAVLHTSKYSPKWPDSTKVYLEILKYHETNFTQFQNSLRYYCRSDVLVQRIFDGVEERLKEREQRAEGFFKEFQIEQENLRMELVERWIRNDLPFACGIWEYYAFYDLPRIFDDEKNCSQLDISR